MPTVCLIRVGTRAYALRASARLAHPTDRSLIPQSQQTARGGAALAAELHEPEHDRQRNAEGEQSKFIRRARRRVGEKTYERPLHGPTPFAPAPRKRLSMQHDPFPNGVV